MRRRALAGCGLAMGLFLLSGCGAKEAPPPPSVEHQVEISPLSSLERSDSGVITPGVKARWVYTAEGRQPGVVAGRNHGIELLLPSGPARILRLSQGFAGIDGDEHRPTEAVFRVILAPGTEREQVLSQETRQGSQGLEFWQLALPLPSLSEPTPLRLEAEYLSRRLLRLAWLDPVVVSQEQRAPPAPGAPNVLLITSDTTRQDSLGIYGGEAPTPHLATLRQDGVLFEEAYSVAFGTTPSHASLMVSRHPAEHGIYDNTGVVDAGFETLAEVLQGQGYATAAFIGARPVVRSLGFAQGFDVYDDLFLVDPAGGLGRTALHQREAVVTVDRFLAWLDRAPDAPFFAWIHLFDPHQPYLPVPGAEPLDEELAPLFANPQGSPRQVLLRGELAEESELRWKIEAEARRRYFAEITYMDSELGRVFERLRQDGLYDNTLVAFISDHGETLEEKGPIQAFGHQGLFAGVTRLPFVLKLPESDFAGQTSTALLGNLDVAPTLLDLLGFEAPEGWAGKSFRRLLGQSSGDAEFRPFLVLEGAHQQEISVRTPEIMYREILPHQRNDLGLYPFLGYADGEPFQLYYLEQDPWEDQELGRQRPEELVRWGEVVREHLRAQDTALAGTLETEEHLEALEALGYIQR